MVTLTSLDHYQNINHKEHLFRSDVKKISDLFDNDMEELNDIYRYRGADSQYSIDTFYSLKQMSSNLSKVIYGRSLASKVDEFIKDEEPKKYKVVKRDSLTLSIARLISDFKNEKKDPRLGNLKQQQCVKSKISDFEQMGKSGFVEQSNSTNQVENGDDSGYDSPTDMYLDYV